MVFVDPLHFHTTLEKNVNKSFIVDTYKNVCILSKKLRQNFSYSKYIINSEKKNQILFCVKK